MLVERSWRGVVGGGVLWWDARVMDVDAKTRLVALNLLTFHGHVP
jgi:hypothetical protein